MVSIIPGIENFDPDLTETSRGLASSPNFCPETFSSLLRLFITSFSTSTGSLFPALKNRAQTVLSGLLQCGVQGAALDTQELIELYYDSYNPDTATRQQLKNFSDLTAPIVTKGEGYAAQPNLDRELS